MDLNAIKNRLSQLQTTTNRTSNLWKPSPGSQVLRIVPYKFNKDNPFIEQGLVNPRKVSTVGLDPINPLTVDFLNDINLGQLADIVEKARSGDLFSTQTPFGQLSFEPEFKGSRPVGGMIRLKGQF